MPSLPRLTEMAHWLATAWLQPGDLAIDATAGNGHDTAFLARLTSPGGSVLAIDVEAEALLATTRKFKDESIPIDHVRLIQGDHANLERLTPDDWFGKVRVIMFNLGYRPRSAWPIKTRLVSTLSAMSQSLSLLADGGLLTIVMYPGHDGGESESQAILEWVSSLDDTLWHVARYDLPNIRSRPPILVAIHKRQRRDPSTPPADFEAGL
jgi:SAM-dependent methyltransferase